MPSRYVQIGNQCPITFNMTIIKKLPRNYFLYSNETQTDHFQVYNLLNECISNIGMFKPQYPIRRSYTTVAYPHKKLKTLLGFVDMIPEFKDLKLNF